jgi:glycosyl hydrolase family 99
VNAALVLLLAGGFAAGPPHHPWTLDRARHVLANNVYEVTDASQPDRPEYELTFSPRAAKALRRGFVFSGSARDARTDTDVRVRFKFVRPGRITRFEGPAADTSQPSFPISATFYYAWYPESWFRDSVFPYSRFHPSLDYYTAGDARIVRHHTDAMRYAHLDAGIYSWWGRDGYPPTDGRFDAYLAGARTTPFRWAIYYEREGYENPTVEKIRSDLEYIRDRYAGKPAYLTIDGRFVVYVYGNSDDSCDVTAARWQKANTVGAYVVLKAFAGFRSCSAQPDAWHQYSAALPEYDLAPDAFMIAPGFDETSEGAPRLARDPPRWRTDAAAMVASNARWQLVLTFNEWPEGTSVESADEWTSPSGYGAYLDVLHEVLP